MNRRVVITGLGLVSPLGIGVKETWESLCAGKSGVDVVVEWDVSTCGTSLNYSLYGGTVGDFSNVTFAECDLGTSGTAAVTLPGDAAWWIITSTNGVDVGSFGVDANGIERRLGGWGTECGVGTQDLSAQCP